MVNEKSFLYLWVIVFLALLGKSTQNCPTTVAFHANSLSNTQLLPGNKLVFRVIKVNQGGAYNSRSGIFVAPQNGTYSFNAHLCLVAGNALGFDVMVGSSVYSSTYARGYTGCGCSSVPAIAVLKQNDQVYLRWKTYSHTSSSVICQSIPQSTFTGMLIN
ncbi:uncharacterized protein LOC132742995 [Ruditapes philippinarum]|uniref:uncharacterized protein LOC132742995 n=1 Tax=Ruditapes philippinarum TaxID=129788 RepID=UPI00295C2CD3|nr:uncharacterized protein LOC132742995 [Ruditapes philippinarum]